MESRNLLAVLAILAATFVVALLLNSSFSSKLKEYFPSSSGNNGGVLGEIGTGSGIPITLTRSMPEIFVNGTFSGNYNQTTVLTANVAPVAGKCTNVLVQFSSDIGNFSSATCNPSGSPGGCNTQCPSFGPCVQVCTSYNNPPCQCSVKFYSSSPGIADIIAQAVQPRTSGQSGTYMVAPGYAPGETSVLVDWASSPCFGNAASCSGFSSDSDACQNQAGCTWYGNHPCLGQNAIPCETYGFSQCSTTVGCKWNSTACVRTNCGDWNASCSTISSKSGSSQIVCTNDTMGVCNSITGCSFVSSACGGNSINCASITDAYSCVSESNCNWIGSSPNMNAASCQGNPPLCGSFSDEPSCDLQSGCSWTLSTSFSGGGRYSCTGTPNPCGLSPDKSTCESQAGCSWIVPNSSSNTPQLQATATTTQSQTLVMTNQTASPGNFVGGDFNCSSVTSGYSCSLDYDNELGEDARIVFILSDSQGQTISTLPYTASSGAATAQISGLCVNPGSYSVSWEAYRISDSTLSQTVAFSTPDLMQQITC